MLKVRMGVCSKNRAGGRVRLAWCAVAWCGSISIVRAQQAVLLPDAPEVYGAQSAVTGVLTGTVQDARDARVANAAVTLTLDGGPARQTTTDAMGRFRLENLPAGKGTLRVACAGLALTVIGLEIKAGETRDLAPISLSVAGLESAVQVTASREDIATIQVALEEKQRVLGIFPNFFVTYINDPAPMTTRQKFSMTTRLEVDPVTILGSVLAAGIEQATDTFPGYRQGVMGYFKRFGANLADGVTADYFAGAIYPTIFRQDPRYFYRGPKYSKLHRVEFAIASAVITRGDNGKWEPNYSNVLGDLTSGGISNLYYPASDRHGAALTFENAGIGVGFSAVTGLIQEFLVKKITPRVPDYDAGSAGAGEVTGRR